MNLRLIKHPGPEFKEKELLLWKLIEDDRIPFSVEITKFDPIEFIKEGGHLVSIAKIGLTHFSFLCEYGFGISQIEQDKYIVPINTKKETGTLFPKHNLSILPYRFMTTPGMTIGEYDYTKGEGYTDENIVQHFKDALTAEVGYINSKNVLFDFRDLGKEMLKYKNLLHSLITNEYYNLDLNIYMYSYE